ncbi:hypothetical protein [Nocardioides dongkuii]|uniref:hypothetical protein n=1 Tax=Nocardioides dongkuii TaxID=2760089 RepID=UPI0015FE1017|nr:hypothetical protein [Nocardioides dongkuii]
METGIQAAQVLPDRRLEPLARLHLCANVVEGSVECLAAFIDTILTGMATQARDGATRQELEAAAALAMTAWPTGAAAMVQVPVDDDRS